MLNDPSQTPETANYSMAVSSAAAIETFVTPVAKLWGRSFGITNAQVIDRLKLAIQDRAHEAFLSSENVNRIQPLLDQAAEKIISEWFSYVLNRDIPSSGRYLAVLRLAFLDCNYEGKWAQVFLRKDFCVQELSAELQAVMIMPTPQTSPREMVRQTI